MSGILVVAEQRRGELRPVSLELIGAAVSLRRSSGGGDGGGGAGGANGGEQGKGELAVAVLAMDPARFVPALSLAGVDEIVAVKLDSAEFEPDSFESAVGALIAARKPTVVLLAHSVDSFGYAAALAARHACGLATDVFRVQTVDGELVATRGGYGQKVNVEVDFPGRGTVLIAIRANAFKPPDGPGTPRVTVFDAPAVARRSTDRGFIEPAGGDDVDMTQAEFILSIGRGVGEEARIAQFRELADAVGATLGCSRPIADAGWLLKSRQVGQSGKTASACKLYIAMGVSGAIQHLAGMKHVPTIVAVNTDAEASIFSVAKYGVVGDIFEIAEELRRHF
jgi:electron transfer flavoprotein alpha subunit